MSPQSTAPSLSTIARLLAIFKELDWPINSRVPGAHPYEDVFNDILELLAYLERDEQELLLTLCTGYLHCTALQYSGLLNEALSQVHPADLDECRGVILLPLKAPKDRGKVKSADGMLYMCRLALPQILEVQGKTYDQLTDPELLNSKHANRDRSLILFVDDFIGSGNTAEDALVDYQRRLRLDTDRVIVVALVAQEIGIKRLNDLGFPVVAARRRTRGISDSLSIRDKPRAIELMKRIEAKIGVKARYSLGYEQSEALVSMMRTPNNTFPVFWWPKLPQDRLRSTPFKR